MRLQLRKRDTSIELLRIIACFFVICIHLGAGFFLNGYFSRAQTFLTCLFADAVAIFWFITGAFLFKKDKYGKVLKGTLRKVILPSLALIGFIFFLDGWMFDGVGVVESIKHAVWRLPSALESVFLWWVTPVAHTGQLWYIFTYVFLMICFPAIKAFVDWLEKSGKEKSFLIISFGILLLNDLSNNHFANFEHTVIGALIPAIILVIWGHIVYKNKDKILAKIKSRYFLIIFIVLNIIRASVLLFNYLCTGETGGSVVYWYSCFSLLTVPSLFLFFEGVMQRETKNRLANWLIIKVGSYTFMIYLLHELVIDYLKKIGLFSDIRHTFFTNGNILKSIAYYIVLGGIIFLIGLILSILLRFFSNCIKKVYSKCSPSRREPSK